MLADDVTPSFPIIGIKDARFLNINNQVGLVIHNGQVFESCLVWSMFLLCI